jgi:hypothetical protein
MLGSFLHRIGPDQVRELVDRGALEERLFTHRVILVEGLEPSDQLIAYIATSLGAPQTAHPARRQVWVLAVVQHAEHHDIVEGPVRREDQPVRARDHEGDVRSVRRNGLEYIGHGDGHAPLGEPARHAPVATTEVEQGRPDEVRPGQVVKVVDLALQVT